MLGNAVPRVPHVPIMPSWGQCPDASEASHRSGIPPSTRRCCAVRRTCRRLPVPRCPRSRRRSRRWRRPRRATASAYGRAFNLEALIGIALQYLQPLGCPEPQALEARWGRWTTDVLPPPCRPGPARRGAGIQGPRRCARRVGRAGRSAILVHGGDLADDEGRVRGILESLSPAARRDHRGRARFFVQGGHRLTVG